MSRVHQTAEALRIALEAILGNKVRGVLTTLGIIIGVLAVITTMTAANGLATTFKESVAVLGTDVLYVSRMPWIITSRFFDFRNRPNLGLKDSDELQQRLGAKVIVNPTANTNRSIKFQSEVAANTPIIGTTEKHVLVSSAVPQSGRFLTGVEVRNKKRVCVIGEEIRNNLFNGVDPINQTMKIGRFNFRVVGVMEKQGSAGFFGGPNFDNQIFIPITTFIKSFGGRNRNFDVAVKAPADMPLEDFEFIVMGEMRKIRKLKPAEDDNFSINQADTLVAAFNNVMGVVLSIGMLTTGISLFVGAIGVMNIMFVSVTERTREIGIRKAIGARRSVILSQFLFESTAICLVGGVIGMAAAFGVAAVINRFLMPATVSWPIVAVAVVVSLIVGVTSGIIPAFRASRLNPIDALRYE